jgi:dipeptidyl-peptidase-3
VRASENYEIHKDLMETILEKIGREIYDESEGFQRIGFRDENNGTTSYYSSNTTKVDAKFIDDWCQELKISPLNTRLFKISDQEFELRIAS